MALSAQQHVDLLDAVIEKRLRGDAFERYTTAERQFYGTPIKDLYQLRRDMQQEAAASGGGMMRLGVPFE